jgi:phage shock protein A
MIANHKQLEVTQEQLRRLELALAELRSSSSELEFRSQAPPVIEHIQRLRSEIDTYLGISAMTASTFRI